MIRLVPGGVGAHAANTFTTAGHSSTILVAGLVATTVVAVSAVTIAVTLWRRQRRPVDVTVARSFAAATWTSPWGADERIDFAAAMEPFAAATRYFTAEAAGTSPADTVTLARPARRHGRRYP